MQPFNKQGQALHDRLSGTVVLRRTPAAAPADLREWRYASFGRRAGATLVDWMLCSLASLPVVVVSVATMSGIESIVAIHLTFFLIAFAYHVTCWTSLRQATIGMMLAGTCVTDMQGQRLSRKRAAGRFLAWWLSLYTAGIGFLIQPFNKERQALHDRLSGTLVLLGEP